MLNYEKWKKLNESFMMSNPMSVISPKGLLAYTPLHEKMEEDEEDVEDEDEDMEDEDEDMEDEDEDMEDEDEDMEDEDEDMEDEDEDMEDEDEDMEDEDEDMEDEDEDMEDEDEDMEDEVDMQDETGEVEVVEDGDEDEDEDEHHHHHHDHGKMVVAKKCGYCGSYMKAENANNFDSSPDFQEWLESVNSIINPRINSRLNGDILNEGTIPPQFVKYIKAKKKGKKVLDKTSSNKGKKVVGKKVVSKKKGKKTASKKTAKKCNCHSTEMKVMPKKSRSMISKKSWKNSPKK